MTTSARAADSSMGPARTPAGGASSLVYAAWGWAAGFVQTALGVAVVWEKYLLPLFALIAIVSVRGWPAPEPGASTAGATPGHLTAA